MKHSQDIIDRINLLNDPNKEVYSEILNEKSNFILSGMYWGANRINENSIYKLTYQEQVDRLIDGCRKHKVNYYFVRFPILEKKGMYITALTLKSQFILNTLDAFPNYKIINVDTDFCLEAYPHVFDVDADCFFINWYFKNNCENPYQLELPGGILGFANTFNAKTALNILNNYILKHPNLAEDKTFSGIFTRNFFSVYTRTVFLPYNYMYMYQQHVYTPGKGYTHIASDKEEFSDNIYSKKDMVITHKDLETYELEDVRKKRITGNIWPPEFYKQQGQKLRCFNNNDIEFINYVNYGLKGKQIKQYMIDFKERASYGLFVNQLLPDLNQSSVNKLKATKNFSLLSSKNQVPLIVTIINSTTKQQIIENFEHNCDKYNLRYIIYTNNTSKSIDKSLLFSRILKKYKTNILYLDVNLKFIFPKIFTVKNMDLITINLNNTYLTNKCYDPRILKTLNDSVYYFAYTPIVLEFLQIWNHFNKDLNNQHKNMEYAFNKSLSINKLRCYWLPKKDILCLRNLQYNNVYTKNQLKMKQFTNTLPQCGLKPKLDKYGNTSNSHFYGSKHGQIGNDKYSKLFLEF